MVNLKSDIKSVVEINFPTKKDNGVNLGIYKENKIFSNDLINFPCMYAMYT